MLGPQQYPLSELPGIIFDAIFVFKHTDLTMGNWESLGASESSEKVCDLYCVVREYAHGTG